MHEKLPLLDLQQRTPIWEALSDFWLDTELVDFQWAHIAQVLADSPYSVAELRDIHDYEVAPALCSNLMCVAGEWAGFDHAWLIERCQHHALRYHSRWYRLRIHLLRPLFRYYTDECWLQVTPRIHAHRASLKDALP